jgi:hypothetical protein
VSNHPYINGGYVVETKKDGQVNRYLGRMVTGRGRLKVVAYVPIYALCVGLACLLWQRPLVLTLAYGLLSVFVLWRWHSRSDVLYFALAAVLGSLGEFIAVGFGAWEYSRPWINIPMWLPPAWGIACLYLKKTTEALVETKAGTEHNNSPGE